jgi:hypothetical protein
MNDHIDELLRRAARVRDEDLVGSARGATAALSEAVVEEAEGLGRTPRSDAGQRPPAAVGPQGGWTPRPRRRRLAIAALAAAALLSASAFVAVAHVASWMSTLQGPGVPHPTGPDVVIASGVSGVAWRIVATQTDQGLCLFLLHEWNGDRHGAGGCGVGSDIYGYPGTTPRGYGADGDRLHWVEGGSGGGFSAGLNRRIVSGVAARQVASVELVLADGRRLSAHLVERPEGIDLPLNFWWAVLPPEVAGVDLTGDIERDLIPVHALVARDGSGAILERRLVDRPNG